MDTNFPVLISSSDVPGATRMAKPSVSDPEQIVPMSLFMMQLKVGESHRFALYGQNHL
jgi:hypothetical protein